MLQESCAPDVPDCLRDRPEVVEAYRRYLSNRDKANQVEMRIATCGVYNAGKSSLLNVLVGRFAEGEEAFETGAARTTSRVSQTQVGQLVYVDTPGIDGGERDDEAAWSGILTADVFLYAHRLVATEFEQREIEFLRKLKKQVKGLKSRLALVITQVDEVHDEMDAGVRLAAILEAFVSAAGFKPQVIFQVSSRRFAKGVAQGKQALVARSGIAELQAWIGQLSGKEGQASWLRCRQDRLDTERDLLVAQIQSIADAVDQDRERRASAYRKRLGAFERAAAALVAGVRGALGHIDAVS